MPLQHIFHDSRAHAAELPNPSGPLSRDLACWHTSEGGLQRPGLLTNPWEVYRDLACWHTSEGGLQWPGLLTHRWGRSTETWSADIPMREVYRDLACWHTSEGGLQRPGLLTQQWGRSTETWPADTPERVKLYRPLPDLLSTVAFARATGVAVWANTKEEKETSRGWSFQKHTIPQRIHKATKIGISKITLINMFAGR